MLKIEALGTQKNTLIGKVDKREKLSRELSAV
jgi:hypothetical protein